MPQGVGVQVPPRAEGIFSRVAKSGSLIFFLRFFPVYRSAVNPAHQEVSVLPLSSGRYQVMWYDASGQRRKTTRNDKAAAETLRRELLAERRAHEEGRFKKAVSPLTTGKSHPGPLVSRASRLYPSLQAVQEWAKGRCGRS
jgi:hypothetical protein